MAVRAPQAPRAAAVHPDDPTARERVARLPRLRRFGSVSAASCAATCWGFMAVATEAGHRIGVMVLLFAAQLRERTARWYEPLPGAVAVAVAVAWMLTG
jgi:hypothetical protein